MSHAPDNNTQLSPIKRALLEIRELRAKLEQAEYRREGAHRHYRHGSAFSRRLRFGVIPADAA